MNAFRTFVTAIALCLVAWPRVTSAANDLLEAVRWQTPPAAGWVCAAQPSGVPGMPPVEVDPSTRAYCLGPAGEVGTVSVADVSDSSNAYSAELMLSSVAGSSDPTWTLWKEKSSGKAINVSDFLLDARGRRIGSMTHAVILGNGFSAARGNVPTLVLKAQVPVQFRSVGQGMALGQVIVVIDVTARLRETVSRNSAEIGRLDRFVRAWAGTIEVDPAKGTRISAADFAGSNVVEGGPVERVALEAAVTNSGCGIYWEVTPTDGPPVYVDVLVDGQVAVAGWRANRTARFQAFPPEVSPCFRPGKHSVAVVVRSTPKGPVAARSKDPVLFSGLPVAPKVLTARALILHDAQVILLNVDPATLDPGATPIWEYSVNQGNGPWKPAPAPVKALDGLLLMDLWDDEPLKEGAPIWIRSRVVSEGKTAVQTTDGLQAVRVR